jgi:geranylgeranyl diphosphate synthase type II
MGAVLGGGTEAQIAAAEEFALALGMAFQIRDDMLDCMGTQEELGKPIGSDVENQKSTFVTLFGLNECQNLVDLETKKAQKALKSGGFVSIKFLNQLAQDLTRRMK